MLEDGQLPGGQPAGQFVMTGVHRCFAVLPADEFGDGGGEVGAAWDADMLADVAGPQRAVEHVQL